MGPFVLANISEKRLESLQALAEQVYGTGNVAEIMREEVKRSLRSVDPYLFDDFGGAEAWQQLMIQMPDPK